MPHVTQPHASRIVKRFARVGERIVHYRTTGTGQAVVMLHDSPRSSRLHLETMAALAGQFRVYALDTPGYGNSAPLHVPEPSIGDLARALGETLAALGLEEAPLYATHTGAKIALDYVATCAKPPPLLLLDGLAIPTGEPDEAFIARYLRPFEIDSGGAYLAAEWTRIRDALRWFPWFDPRPDRRMSIRAPSPAWIADYALDLFTAGPTYSHAYAGALRYDPRPALRAVASPVIVAAREDDVLYGALDLLPDDRSTTISIERLPAERDHWLNWLRRRFADVAARSAGAVGGGSPAPDGPIYVDLPHGQMLVHRVAGQATRSRPLLILETPTTLHARLWQEGLADARATLVPELPGYGESDPLERGTLADHVAAVAAMLHAIDVPSADVLAIGLAAPLAIALAIAHPSRVGMLILDGASIDPRAVDEIGKRLCPAFTYDPAGAHLHRIWHMVRDGEAQWPWFDTSAEAARCVTPEFAPAPLHRALVDILKQPAHYGEAALAGLAADLDLAAVTVPVLMFDLAGDPAYDGVAAMAGRLPHARIVSRPADIGTSAARLAKLLDEDATYL